MSDKIKDGCSGISLREYACIQLKVPATGEDWLDELILKSLRNDFAVMAMQATLPVRIAVTADQHALIAYEIADAMLSERERGRP